MKHLTLSQAQLKKKLSTRRARVKYIGDRTIWRGPFANLPTHEEFEVIEPFLPCNGFGMGFRSEARDAVNYALRRGDLPTYARSMYARVLVWKIGDKVMCAVHAGPMAGTPLYAKSIDGPWHAK